MKFWLIALPRADIEHCIKKGVFGMRRKHVLGNVKPGDKVGCYITRGVPVWLVDKCGSPAFDFAVTGKWSGGIPVPLHEEVPQPIRRAGSRVRQRDAVKKENCVAQDQGAVHSHNQCAQSRERLFCTCCDCHL